MKSKSFFRQLKVIAFSFILFVFAPKIAEGKKKKNDDKGIKIDTSLFSTLKYRNIGPFRGGRSAAVSGVKGKSRTFYMGATGGGVWKTLDAGNSWKNISDGYFGGTIGSIAVSDSDPNVIYVGGGV